MGNFTRTKGPADSVYVVNWSQIGSGDLQPVIDKLQGVIDAIDALEVEVSVDFTALEILLQSVIDTVALGNTELTGINAKSQLILDEIEAVLIALTNVDANVTTLLAEVQAVKNFLLASDALASKTYLYADGTLSSSTPATLIAAPGVGNYLSVRNATFQNIGTAPAVLTIDYGTGKEFSFMVSPYREVIVSSSWDDELGADENVALLGHSTPLVDFMYWIQYRQRSV